MDNTRKASKRHWKSRISSNRLKDDFSKELGQRKCIYCTSYSKYSKVCSMGNKPSSKYICYKFIVNPEMEDDYKYFVVRLREKYQKNTKKSVGMTSQQRKAIK